MTDFLKAIAQLNSPIELCILFGDWLEENDMEEYASLWRNPLQFPYRFSNAKNWLRGHRFVYHADPKNVNRRLQKHARKIS